MELDEQPETFRDIARICVKKNNKGPFDELITTLFRIKQLTEFIPHIDSKWDKKTVLMKCISQGLKYSNFKSFKDEVSAYPSFSDLENCSSIKEFYALLTEEENQEPIHKKLLQRFQGILHEHEFSLSFLKNWVAKDIEELEQQAEYLKITQPNG